MLNSVKYRKAIKKVFSYSLIFSVSSLFSLYDRPALADIAANSNPHQYFAIKNYTPVGKFRAEQVLENPEVAASVELELSMLPILDILTTTDGKVATLLQETSIPEELSAWMNDNNKDDINDVYWDELSRDMKMLLLQHISAPRKGMFFDDRKIPNIKVKERISLKVKKGTKFSDSRLKPGWNKDVDVSQNLSKYAVEYRGPNDVENATGVELHFREKQPAGQVHEDAWTLLDGLHVDRNHQHIHIVAPIPYKDFKKYKEYQAVLMSDFVRRANLLSEMLNVLLGYPVSNVEEEDKSQGYIITYFGSMSFDMLKGIADYFLTISDLNSKNQIDKIPAIRDKFKMGWVGFRGRDKYDGPIDLWGIEYRDISPMKHTNNSKNILNSLQWMMNKNKFGITAAQMKKWDQHTTNGDDLSMRIANTWYNQEMNTLLGFIPNHAGAAFPGGMNEAEVAFIKKLAEHNTEIKMLLFNWDNDPLFFDNEKKKDEIKKAQSVAIASLLNMPVVQEFMQSVDAGDLTLDEENINDLVKKVSVNEIMKCFIIDSNLLFAVTKSLNLKLKPKLHVLLRTLKARKYNAKEITSFLADFEMNINSVGSKSNTLLSLAVAEGEEELALKLIDANANRNVYYYQDGHKYSLLEMATKNNLQRIKTLLSNYR